MDQSSWENRRVSLTKIARNEEFSPNTAIGAANSASHYKLQLALTAHTRWVTFSKKRFDSMTGAIKLSSLPQSPIRRYVKMSFALCRIVCPERRTEEMLAVHPFVHHEMGVQSCALSGLECRRIDDCLGRSAAFNARTRFEPQPPTRRNAGRITTPP